MEKITRKQAMDISRETILGAERERTATDMGRQGHEVLAEGHHKNGGYYVYFRAPDNYVYQMKDRVVLGWLCSYEAWVRTLHRITEALR